MTYQKALISCIMPVYNRQQLLANAIESVIKQNYLPIELIIINDGSTDDTADVIENYQQKYLNIIRSYTIENQGPGVARQYGINKARGEFIHFLDSDDLIDENKYSQCIKHMHSYASSHNIPIEMLISYDITHFYDISHPEKFIIWNNTDQAINQILPASIYQRIWATSTPIYHRQLINQIGEIMPWDCEEDLEMDIRIGLLNHHLVHVNQYLTDFRAHPFGRTSVNKDANHVRLKKIIRSRSAILKHIQSSHYKHDKNALLYFSKSMFLVCRQCYELYDKKSANEAWELSWQASKPSHIRQRLLLIIYKFVSKLVNPKILNR